MSAASPVLSKVMANKSINYALSAPDAAKLRQLLRRYVL
jgi:hypothetical protein